MATLTQIKQRFWDNDGSLLSGGKVYIYLAGTSTLTNSYTDATGTVANTNPVILDAKGEASIWTSGLVKINVLNSSDVQVTGYPVDNVGPAEYYGSDGTATISAVTTLTSGYINKVTTLSGTTYTVTLPAANTVQDGSTLQLKCTASGDITIARASTDTIGMSSASVTSMTMKSGDTLTLVSNGSNQWIAINSKAIEFDTVLNYGADRSGVSDSRTAFNNANTAGPVIITRGVYKISSNITIGNVVTFMEGASISIDTGVVVTFTNEVTAPAHQIFSGLGTVVLSKKQTAIPEWWGATNGGSSAAAINKMIAACTANTVPVHFSQAYLLENYITVPPDLPVTSSAKSSFTATGGNTNAILISTGNGVKQIYPKIFSFSGVALKMAGVSLADIYTHEITGCGDAVVLETLNATHPNTLDNRIEVFVMSTNTNGFRLIADNAANVSQGNEFYCNFCTSTLRSVFYDANGITPNFDSNKFVFQAIDPTPALGANTRGLYSNMTTVSRCTFRVESWLGGFASTSKYVDGNFNALNAYLSLAETPANYAMFNIVGTGNTIDTRLEYGKGSAYVTTSNTAANRAGFNGGLPLWGNIEKLRITVAGAAIIPGATYDAYIYHIKTDQNSQKYSIIPLDMKGAIVTLMFDNSTTNANEILIRVMNVSTVNIAIGTNIDFYFRIGI